MKKNFVLDTNVLLHDPRAIFQFADNNVIIPIYVLEEIDQFKKELSERGRNAREVARHLDELRADGGHLSEGVAAARAAGSSGSRSASASCPTAAAQRDQIADNLILGGGARGPRRRTGACRPSSSPRTSTCASAPTRSGLTAEDYDAEQHRASRSSTRATPSSTVPRRRRSTRSTRRARLAELEAAAQDAAVYANEYVLLRRPRQPVADARSAAATRRQGKRVLADPQAARGRVGHPAAQQGAALRARPAAQRRHQAGDARRQGRHRQDAARDRRRPAEGRRGGASTTSCWSRGRSSRSAATSATCPATSRRSSTRGCSRSTTTSSSCSGFSKDATRRTGAATHGADRPRLHRDRAADLHPRPLASPTSS